MKPVYLKGLNGLRAIAAMAVVISHSNIALDKYFHTSLGLLDVANFGVTMFFTLSGFLITYLLLIEKQVTSTVAVRKFYIRRLLRIWPLYFLYIFVVVFFFNFTITPEIWYYLLFVPNVAFAIQSTIPLLAHYWSLGVEEQFYLFWPWIAKKVQHIKLFFIIFIALFFILKVAFRTVFFDTHVYTFLHYSRFGVMAIGGLGAFYFFTQKERLSFLKSWPVHFAAWMLVAMVAINKFHISSIVDHEIFAVATLVLILNQVDNPATFVSLEKPLFDYLGKISFGIYVYNPLVIHVVMPLAAGVLSGHRYFVIAVAYVLCTALVILMAHASYFFFERRFLSRKYKYAVIKSQASGGEQTNSSGHEKTIIS